MKRHGHPDGWGRHPHRSGDRDCDDRRHRHRGSRRGGRLFDYGELRLLLLAMLLERPSHGYELIKAVEQRFGGSYTPSPGVVYPTLAWLEDMGYAVLDAEEAGRKRYAITGEGAAFLHANRQAADELLTRVPPAGWEAPPAPVLRAMENLKLALRLRRERGPLDAAAVGSIAAAIDEAARKVDQS